MNILVQALQLGNESLWQVSSSEGISMLLSPLGACLRSLTLDSKEITLGWKDTNLYSKNRVFFGVTVGRYANRIKNACFTLAGKKIQLDGNDNGNSLHGGWDGFHNQVWQATSFETGDIKGVEFSIQSPAGHESFPGNMVAKVRIALGPQKSLYFDYEAKVDAACPCNFTNHTYWNLAGESSGSIEKHTLQLDCTHYLPVDGGIPNGTALPLKGSIYDFSFENDFTKTLQAGGVDHNFVLDPKAPKLTNRFNNRDVQLRRAAILKAGGRKMEVYTDKPGIQVYSGNYLVPQESRTGPIGKHGGLCLETQLFPDSPNQADTWRKLGTSIGYTQEETAGWDSILEPGKTYRSLTMHRFS